MKKIVRIFLAIFALATLGACGGKYAQTPDEWLFHFKQGTLLRGTTVSEINRPTKQVIADLSEFSGKCINGMVIRTTLAQGNNMGTSIVRYSSGVKPTSDGANLFYIQTRDKNFNAEGMPEDGIFVFATEITSLGNKTKIASHHLTMSEKYVAPVKDWANGKKNKCPKNDS